MVTGALRETRWCHGVMVSWCHGVMVSWCHGVAGDQTGALRD